MPIPLKNSLYFSLLTGIWRGERFALDCVHRHKVCIINNVGEKTELLAALGANSRLFPTERDERKLSPDESPR
jgi:hypothetical protein